ncbi:hypothetical protein I540_0264 [Mycobacteroides abscessus subsp. bolletii 1513]|uniref:PadR family transcriptional regulator n=1 Tax=Mycobacteroides abscessus subsp. bolletii 1513 TaxID=1299321 RepID=X8E0X2_9MYCO|nr:hypothetical protein I540_0264 [Mycobacteroides abscessus subsp. bolletii 1513]
MARFFRHGELPLVLLALLAQRPMHGYELMSELSRLFGPAGISRPPERCIRRLMHWRWKVC